MTTQTLKNWQEYKLGDLAQDVRNLYAPSKGEKLPYVGLEHIEQQTLQLSGIGQSNETESTKKIFKSGDILFGTLRPYFRKVIMPKFDGVCSTDIAVIRPTEKGDGNFLKYFIANQDFIGHASNISSGTRMPRANWKVLKDQQWLFPNLKEQKTIGDFLVVYDDLIENNTRRIKVLEQMAQAIYTEWFVNFRFPGHEKVKMIESGTEFGKIPEGWEVKLLPEVFDFLEGPGIRNWQYTETGCPFINIRLIKNNDINISSASFISKEEADGKYNHFHLQERDMVVSTSGTLGRSAIVRKEHLPLLLNTSVIRFKPIDGKSYAFMYQFLNATYFQNKILSMASGSAQPNFGPMHLKQIKMFVPSQTILDIFENLAGSLYSELLTLLSENQNLRQTRDLLLPKLVTGEIQV